MCLRVFVKGDEEKYNKLKEPAMRLGSAFQKVNFLRDLKDDVELLNRSYFPNVDLKELDNKSKEEIVKEIEADVKTNNNLFRSALITLLYHIHEMYLLSHLQIEQIHKYYKYDL